MYKYSNHLLAECTAQLYLRNDSIHEHSIRGCQLLRVPRSFYTSAKDYNSYG